MAGTTIIITFAVECTNPGIQHGYTDLSPPESEIFAAQLTKQYNESLYIYCKEGYYMDGPNVAYCQASGQWTQLPTCRGKSSG